MLNNPTPPKRPRGRPAGATKREEPASKALKIALTPTAYEWAKAQPRGTIPEMIEKLARS